ncbi:membrane insertase OXA1 [Sporobolomyces salmoneus]|uniref:membrane insertase OXA1 n=1 Tax=Sporobolomyces salmoneus TaxID=183962 RepID=UPI00316C6BB4
MAGVVPRNALRALLSPSNPALYRTACQSPLLALAARPSPSIRRTFSTSPRSLSWLPSISWNTLTPATPVKKEETASTAANEFETLASQPTESSIAPPPPPPSSLPPTPTPTAAVVEPSSTTETLTQHVYDGINTGSLDISALSGSFGPHPIMRLQSLFLHLHESFPLLGSPGLAWFLLIPVVTLVLRFALLPFQIRAQSNAARLAIIQPQMLKGMEKLKAAKARGDQTGMQAAQMETQQLMRDNNVNPIKNLVFPLAQATVFMTMFFAIRGLSGAGLESMQLEGFGWVQDLTKADPYWILPVASTGLTLATLETGVDSTTQVQTSTTKNMKMIFRIALVLALPMVAYFPAALLLYWTTNNFLSLFQASVLKLPSIRSLLSIPTPPPKPQPGDANYVPEPSFTEAFKNMQVGMQEKWEETKETTERQRAEKEKWNPANLNRQAEVYTPRKTVKGPRYLRGVETIGEEMWEQGKNEAKKGGVLVGPSTEAQLSERDRRVAEARRRRQRK